MVGWSVGGQLDSVRQGEWVKVWVVLVLLMIVLPYDLVFVEQGDGVFFFLP